MKAVVWTDLFQGVVMLVGILTVLIVVSFKLMPYIQSSNFSSDQFAPFSNGPISLAGRK